MKRASNFLWFLGSVGVFALLLFGWHLIAQSGMVSRVYLAPPDKAFAAITNGFTGPNGLGSSMWATVQRMLYGWVLASMVGIVLGSIIGISAIARIYLQPMLEFLRPLPASAIVPLAIAFFGLSESMVLFVIAFGSFWPVLLAAVQGVSSVEPRLYEVARALNMSRRETIWKIALPNALPDIFAGMRIGLAVALVLTVVGEFVGGQNGLGLEILRASRQFQAPRMFGGVILLGVIGYSCAVIISNVERYLMRWRASR
ncbi:ABC transporter permease [Mesorhizobium sp. Z1-4]|uniref:ABC transporter permease n=1 Tax=Mesorhizobium sp. Z1-4 TaxID=2448478 RepID=UPI00197F5250|nr:ABC transporter permease [Mesorhizobium sp. Z1-4]